MAVEIARETRVDSDMEVSLHLEYFVSLPKPYVRLFGAAKNEAGRPLANMVDLSASKYHYNVVVELPRARFCDNEVEWSVDHNSEVTIEGQINSAAIFVDKPLTGNRRNRIQLCPTEPWAISFYVPGQVDWWTTLVTFTSDNFMEILVRKSNVEIDTSISSLVAFESEGEAHEAQASPSGSTASVSPSGTSSVPVRGTSATGSTDLVRGADLGPRPQGDTPLNPSEVMDMVDGWFE